MRNGQMQAYRQNQIGKKKKEAEIEYMNQRRDEAEANALRDQEEKNYLSYAEQCLKEWGDQGKNIKPLLLELKKQKAHVQK